MKVIEKFILGKNKDQSKCEDIIFINNDFAAIIDGATTKSEYTFNGNSTGKQAAVLVKEALETINPEATKEETASYITQHIYNFYKKENYLSKIRTNAKNKCTASVIIYSHFHSEIWMFGDCHCLIDGRYYEANKLIDFICHSTRSIVVGALLKKGHKINDLLENDLSRESIEPILTNQQNYQNIPKSESQYGYVCFDGFEVPTQDVETIYVPKTARKIILASDGYPKLLKNLKLSEQYLEKLKEEDPLCYDIYPSTKGFNLDLNSYDDRSYLSFKIK